MTMNLDQQIQIARTVRQALQQRDPKGAQFVRAVSAKTGLSNIDVVDMIHATAGCRHSMDRGDSVSDTFREFFRHAG